MSQGGAAMAGHDGGGGGGAMTPRRQKFFKVLLPGSSFASTLSLPPKFAARLDIPPGFAVATLRDPAGRSWQVGLDPQRRSFAGLGWRSFLAGTGACGGHLLVFEHLGGLCFSVEHFDASGCSLDVRPVESTASWSVRDADADTESGSKHNWSPVAAAAPYTPVAKRRKGDESTCIIERPFHLQYLELTKALCDRLGWTAARTVKLRVVGGGERLWKVSVRVRNKGGMIMSGWPEFTQDNSLTVSDACVFTPLLLPADTDDQQLVQVQVIRGFSLTN